MIKKIAFSMFVMIFTSCFSSRSIDFTEPLICAYGKEINLQYVQFLEKKGAKYKVTCYRYYIDLKKNIVIVSAVYSKFYELNSGYVDLRCYNTTENFRKHVSAWYEKYYKTIHPNFLNMENFEKMQILDSLSKVPVNPVQQL